MFERVAVIVGPFRSGTALVAQVVHRLGFQVAPMIPAPGPPAWRSDYEDPELTIPLMRGERPSVEQLREYLASRRALAERMGFAGVALKSGYLALIWKNLMAAIGEPAVVVRTYRDEVGRLASLAAHPALSLDDDAAIRAALWRDVQPTLEVGYGWATDDPSRCARTLAQALGVDDDAAIAAAAALVQRPTDYAHGLQDRQSR